MPSQPLRAAERGTAANGIVALHLECAAVADDPRDGGLVHRLDGGTSGALAAARTRDAWKALRAAFADGKVAKTYLALVDVIPLFVVGLMGAGLILPHKLHGRLQGVVTLIGAIVLILTALVLLIVAIVEVILMVTLLFAFPFGTIAYLIIWGSFPRGDAVVILSLLMFLKLVFAAALVAAQQRFIQNKGLVLLVLTSLVANLIVAFLHGLVPGFLVSITDGIAAIVLAIIAIIWAIVLLIGAIPAIVKAVRSTASTVESTAANTAKAVGSTAARRLPA